jgi:hypothetical protein
MHCEAAHDDTGNLLQDTALGTRPRERSSKVALCKFETVNTWNFSHSITQTLNTRDVEAIVQYLN